MPRVFVTAAEISGERHAAKLVRALRALRPEIEFDGLGGPAMRDAGVNLLADTVGNARMGLGAFLRAREVWALLHQTRARYRSHKPDLHICVDSWTMNSHFAKLAKRFDVPVLYYIAPQTWASREGRVRKMRRVIDRLACILPFEQDYFRSHGVNATFVGHPLFDDLPRDRAPAPGPRFPDVPPVIALPAGSRRSVARANFPRQLAVARLIRDAFPGARFFVPTTANTDAVVREAIGSLDWVEARRDAFDDIARRADLAITVSGTAAVHLAAWNVPMIVVYAGSRVLWHALGRWMIRTRTFSLVNLLSADPSRKIVPEFVPWFGPVTPVAECAIELLRDSAKRSAQKRALAEMISRVDGAGASDRAARLALELLDEPRG
jgi:lipid-A-disaccharide synthase